MSEKLTFAHSPVHVLPSLEQLRAVPAKRRAAQKVQRALSLSDGKETRLVAAVRLLANRNKK